MSSINKLYLIFPDTHKPLCDIVSQGLEEMLKITCQKTNYNLSTLDLQNIYQISKSFDDKSILILAYWDVIPSESFYKLGIAFEKKSSIILINIQSKIQNMQEIPPYVKNDYSLTLLENENVDLRNNLRNLLIDLEQTIKIILADNNLIDDLYHRSLIYCKRLEEKTNHIIDKVDFNVFRERIMSFEKNSSSDTLTQLFKTKSDELYSILLSCIASDKLQIYEVLTIARNLAKERENIDKNSKNITNNITYHQYGKNDNIGGDNVKRDKIG